MPENQCLIVGCGYLGTRVADQWRERGFQVFTTTRSASRAEELKRKGFQPIVLDIAESIRAGSLPQVRFVLFAVGFDRSALHSQKQVYVEGLKNVLAALPGAPERFIYVSSTGVYGQSDNSWVDEQSPTEPTREGGRCCLEAERLLMEHPMGKCSLILRMAGIYGPDRLPFLQKMRDGQPLPVATDGYLNLIHVEDAARIVDACTAEAMPVETQSPQLLVVSDGHPVIRRTYYDYVARLIGVTARYDPPDGDAPRTRRAMGSKRVCNHLMRDKLRVRLRFPRFEQGLKAILTDGETQADS
ncbi:MAG: SDR family oxidoreductase [Pirellulaceae bacterium]|nr:SDR family oxidoreductase [Pirellulaceae bacterium]